MNVVKLFSKTSFFKVTLKRTSNAHVL